MQQEAKTVASRARSQRRRSRRQLTQTSSQKDACPSRLCRKDCRGGAGGSEAGDTWQLFNDQRYRRQENKREGDKVEFAEPSISTAAAAGK
jgi:hypothetical protein